MLIPLKLVSTPGFIPVSLLNPNMEINCFKISNLFHFKKITKKNKTEQKKQTNYSTMFGHSFFIFAHPVAYCLN